MKRIYNNIYLTLMMPLTLIMLFRSYFTGCECESNDRSELKSIFLRRVAMQDICHRQPYKLPILML